MLKVLTTATNSVEQRLLLARLKDAGIPCMVGAGGARTVLGAGRDVLVEESDLARAEMVLKEEDEGFDEEELTRLSEEAGRAATD
jgi:Putative prokaryotic signal transducing protein